MGFKELAIATRAATCSNSNYSVAKITEILNTELCVPIPVKAYLDRDINNVNIPTSCTKIGACAFAGCQYITEIRIPASVTSIGEDAFHFNKGHSVQVKVDRDIYCDWEEDAVSGAPWGAPMGTTFHYTSPLEKPLTFTAQQTNVTISLTKTGSPTVSGLQYRTKSTAAWASYTIDTKITLASIGDYVQFQNTENTLSTNASNYVKFVITGRTKATGNIQSMLNWQTACAPYCYRNLFYYCEKLTTAPLLPATTLATDCYYGMFNGCKSLTTAPELPATTLVRGCYDRMFSSCSSLTTAPELPATTLADDCYYNMFSYCTSLTTAPELPATTLARDCYESMFSSCSSLTTAPELPATTLVQGCYNSMFSHCTSLTTAPELPATTLVQGCYQYMFSACSKLNSIKVSFTDWSGTCTEEWVYGVASSGTFRCPSTLLCKRGDSYVPEGWACGGAFVLTYYVHQKCESSAITTSITNSETPPSGYEYTGKSFDLESDAISYANSIKGTSCGSSGGTWLLCVYSNGTEGEFGLYMNEGSCSNHGHYSHTILECSISGSEEELNDIGAACVYSTNTVTDACACISNGGPRSAALLLSDTPDDLQ